MATEIRLVVRGRVQGVGFRWFVRERATRLGVSGWVRNLPDGCVELAARGDPDAVEQLRQAVAAGPPGALVAAVEQHPLEDSRPLDHPFAIRRH